MLHASLQPAAHVGYLHGALYRVLYVLWHAVKLRTAFDVGQGAVHGRLDAALQRNLHLAMCGVCPLHPRVLETSILKTARRRCQRREAWIVMSWYVSEATHCPSQGRGCAEGPLCPLV